MLKRGEGPFWFIRILRVFTGFKRQSDFLVSRCFRRVNLASTAKRLDRVAHGWHKLLRVPTMGTGLFCGLFGLTFWLPQYSITA